MLGLVRVDRIRDKLPVVRLKDNVFAEVTVQSVFVAIVRL